MTVVANFFTMVLGLSTAGDWVKASSKVNRANLRVVPPLVSWAVVPFGLPFH